jgi:hypothetical protein
MVWSSPPAAPSEIVPYARAASIELIDSDQPVKAPMTSTVALVIE